jgi:stage IV sporulation protein FB
MKKSYLKIHQLTIIFLFIAFITGYFKYIIYFLSLVYIHELGHVTMGILMGWKVEKIVLCPFGGMTYFNELVNRPIKEEIMIAIMGPIYQQLFYLTLCYLGFYTDTLMKIHYFLLLFNLLPIYPLDGSKLWLLLYQKCFSFYSSYSFILILSIIFILILIYFNCSFLILILCIFFLYHISVLYKSKQDIFYKFLIERTIYKFNFKKVKKINHVRQMKRDYYHLFLKNNKYITEKNYLKNTYKEIMNQK